MVWLMDIHAQIKVNLPCKMWPSQYQSNANKLVLTWDHWNIINWTLRNKPQWNFNQNSYIFIQENAYETVVCKNDGYLVLASM